ncbi:MAG TPA: hypothetical protein VGN77_08430, partial [Steroidobacteraceae bacterium]|nr:hypothetical protein [Steroidobacteraceae bacterium]
MLISLRLTVHHNGQFKQQEIASQTCRRHDLARPFAGMNVERSMSWIRSVPASLVALSLFAWPVQGADSANSSAPLATWRLQARVVAVGLPGVAGVRQVGRFHSGGPIPSNPEFLLQTAAGRVLDAERVLVAVTGNFGAPLGSAAY